MITRKMLGTGLAALALSAPLLITATQSASAAPPMCTYTANYNVAVNPQPQVMTPIDGRNAGWSTTRPCGSGVEYSGGSYSACGGGNNWIQITGSAGRQGWAPLKCFSS